MQAGVLENTYFLVQGDRSASNEDEWSWLAELPAMIDQQKHRDSADLSPQNY